MFNLPRFWGVRTSISRKTLDRFRSTEIGFFLSVDILRNHPCLGSERIQLSPLDGPVPNPQHTHPYTKLSLCLSINPTNI